MNTKSVAASRARRDTYQPTSPPSASGRNAFALRNQRAIRCLDVLISFCLLCLLAVPMLLLALAIRLTSRGPALYLQERTGFGGKPFVMYKFRTMRYDAERDGSPVWAKPYDPRCTALGVILRRFGLDELPQLFNVLAGQMSLVGPRPERPYFVERFARTIPAYNQRHQVPPGITGWAQINGWRGDSSIEKRLEFDLYYVNRRTVRFYFRVLLLTPLRVLLDTTVR